MSARTTWKRVESLPVNSLLRLWNIWVIWPFHDHIKARANLLREMRKRDTFHPGGKGNRAWRRVEAAQVPRWDTVCWPEMR